MRTLQGRVAVVAGATRGAGRAIACTLGEAGATVYCTGRSVRGIPAMKGRPETIEETAEMVTAGGGQGIWASCSPPWCPRTKKRIRDMPGYTEICRDIVGCAPGVSAQ